MSCNVQIINRLSVVSPFKGKFIYCYPFFIFLEKMNKLLNLIKIIKIICVEYF